MRVIGTDYGAAAVEALRAVVSGLKADDPMASVTILVPNNRAGIVARRQLAGGLADGPRPGVAALHVSTLPRLAEQLAAASLAPRRPATRPLVAAAWRRALTEGVTEQAALVRALVGSALDSELVKRAAVRAHWRERTSAPSMTRARSSRASSTSSTARTTAAW